MRILNVSEFVELVNGVLRAAWEEDEIAVEGEISGYRVSQGQWVTFDIKDDKALVNVFLPVWNLGIPLEDGFRVRVIGVPRVYPKYGKFSMSATRVELVGDGALRKALAALRTRLDKEGVFDPTRKRELPHFPSRIALVASRESAAYGDFLRIVNERWGGLEIDVYHVLVQGDRAPQDIVCAIQQANENVYDALVLTRGGGSFEELMAFNDESVVRAIHGSRIPTLVAIGHERDVSLAEEAADVRGSTPTDCARRLVPDRRDSMYEVATRIETIESMLVQQMEQGHSLVNRAMQAPHLWLHARRADIETFSLSCVTSMRQWILRLSERLQSDLRLLSSLDPARVLTRGYAMLEDGAGKAIPSVARLKVGDGVRIRLHDGTADGRITSLPSSTRQARLL